MDVAGSLTPINREELTANAALVKRIWLAIPNNLEQYIYVDPDTMNAYIRPPTVPPNTPDMKCKPIFKIEGQTYVLDKAANDFNKGFCTTQITPDLLAMLPAVARNFIINYIQSRRRRISEVAIQSDKEYQDAVKSFQSYKTDLSGLSLKVLASKINQKINGSDTISGYASGASAKIKAYLTRMIQEGTSSITAVESTHIDYIGANTAYSKYKSDESKDPNLSTTSTDGLISIYLPEGTARAKSLLAAMIISSTNSVNAVDTTEADFTAARNAYTRYRLDLAGNVTLLAKSSSDKVRDYTSGKGDIVAAYFTVMLQINNADIGLIDKNSTDFKNAQAAFTQYKAVPADASLSYNQKVSKYIPTGSPLAKAYFGIQVSSTDTEKASFNLPPALVPTFYFSLPVNGKKLAYDKIAQAFYDLGDGTQYMSYIYDILPVGRSIIDVRFDLVLSPPTSARVERMKSLTAAYRTRLQENLSVNQREALIWKYQSDFAAIRDSILEDPAIRQQPETRRFFYTLEGGIITINGMARDKIAAGSFYTAYNCGLDVPDDDSPGNINYTPITLFNKNASDTVNCRDRGMLTQIGIDYVNALSYDMADLLRTVSSPWDRISNLHITKVLGVQQLTPMTCNLQWEETSFDSITNKPDKTVMRNVYVAYRPNTFDWFSTEIFFDASATGFKYLSSAPAGLTMLNPPMVLIPPYFDDAKLDSGGICKPVSCSDPATLYKMVDDYNTTKDNPGLILRVVKAVTMNAGQCDLLVDMDYNAERPNFENEDFTGTVREQISFIMSLNVPTCTYDLVYYDIGYGIQDETPLMKDASGNVKPLDYIFNFGVNIFTEISKAANRVKDQIASVYDIAKDKLTSYRESTYATTGNIQTFSGCPDIRCHNIDILSDIFRSYDRANRFKNRMGKIIQVGTSVVAPNTCDVIFENNPIAGWDSIKGEPTYGPTQTSAARFSFISDTASAYDSIFDAQIAELTRRGAPEADIQVIRDEKALIASEVSCSFITNTITPIRPIEPTPWIDVSSASSLPILNKIKKDDKTYTDMFPFPNPFPSMTVNCEDYRILNTIREKSIERRFVRRESAPGGVGNVIGYNIDSSVPNNLAVTDITADDGLVSMKANTVVYSKNADNQTCAVEMIMDGGYRVNRQFTFDTDDGFKYTLSPKRFIATMPFDPNQSLAYNEFRDISYSGIYSGITSKTPFSLTDPVHTYTYRERPNLLNLPITNPLPLVVDPACRLDMTNLTTLTAALAYNGYTKAYEVATFPSTYRDLSNSYEVRITNNEYLPFGVTYKIVSFYTNKCNPIVNTFAPSTPAVSQLARRIAPFDDSENLRALRDHINNRFGSYRSDAKPQRKLGQIWKGGFDSVTRLYIYEVTMGEYDAGGATLNFYGYPQNIYDPIVIPRGYLACEFRKRFDNPTVTYLANMFVRGSPPSGVTMNNLVDPSPIRLDDPFQSMTSYRHLEFTPLSVRTVPQRPNKMVQLTRLEFYHGNILQPFTGSLTGEALAPGATVLQSVSRFDSIFKTDGQTVDLATQSCFVCLSGTPIRAYSANALKVDGLSFMTGRDPAFDPMQWRLRGSMNGSFWKTIYTSPQLDYRPYGFWRVPMMTIGDTSVQLPQNATRPKGFIECGAAVNTLDMVTFLSNFAYTTYSRSFFNTYEEGQKNTSRVYLTDLSDHLIDDLNNTVYVRAKIQTLDSTYTLRPGSLTFSLSFQRKTTCPQIKDYTLSTVSDSSNIIGESFNNNPLIVPRSFVPFRGLVFTPTLVTKRDLEEWPFAYKGYPSALGKYTNSSISLEPVPPYTVTTFLSNGPDRPARMTLSQAITNYSNMDPEGAAQMCLDNATCLGFSVNPDSRSGSFISTPNEQSRIVDSARTGSFYVKAGFTLVQYVRFRSMRAGPQISLSKVAFYKGSTLVSPDLNAGNSFEINAAGAQTGSVLIGWELANLLNYTTTAGWKATGVDGFLLRFKAPLIFDGYTFVTTSLPSSSDPTAWIMETSMNGTNWTLYDTRTGITPPAARFSVYPIFRPSNESGISLDFIPKTLSSCNMSCVSLLPQMISLYMNQQNPNPNNFLVNKIGYDTTSNQCLLGWDDAAGKANVTGVIFNPVFGECSTLSAPSNMTIKTGLTATGLTRIPDTGPFLYVRFKPTGLNGGRGTSLSFIGFLYRGVLLSPSTAINVSGNDNPSKPAGNTIETTLINDWKCEDMGNLIITFRELLSADSFTMIAGSDAACAPVTWILESSPDGIVWSLLHEQSGPFTAPAAKRQYPVYHFDGTVTTPVKGVLDRTISDAGYTCASHEIINGNATTVLKGVNDAAFDKRIFFNPVGYTYDNLLNQCKYSQGTDGSTLTVTFSTIKSGSTSTATSGFITTVTKVESSPTPLANPTPFTSGLQGIADCDPKAASYACDNDTLLDSFNSTFKNPDKNPINKNGTPLSATKSGYDANKNECLFELEDMYTPLTDDGTTAVPSKQIGFQIKKNVGCTVPGAQALIINKKDTAQSLSTPSVSGPYRFIRFKVRQGGLKIGAFEFFKQGTLKEYAAEITNPLGSNRDSQNVPTPGLRSFTDSSVKPIQFKFTQPLDFDGYSWTTSEIGGSDPIAWTLQASTNGYIWTDIDSREDTSSKGRRFKMPVYTLNGGATARDTAIARTYSLAERGITCNSLTAQATIAIAGSQNSIDIATENDFDTNSSNILIVSTNINNTNSNTCSFSIRYKDDLSIQQYTAVIKYKMANSMSETAVVDSVTVS